MHDWAGPFLRAIAEGSTISEAAAVAGVSSSTVNGRRKRDADFDEGYRAALEDSTDVLEREARRRAIDGVAEPVIYQGQPTYVHETDEAGYPIFDTVQEEQPGFDDKGNPIVRLVDVKRPRRKLDANGQPVILTVRKPSDALLALLLKGRRKDVFAERKELTGKDGAELKPAQIVISTGVPADEVDISDIA